MLELCVCVHLILSSRPGVRFGIDDDVWRAGGRKGVQGHSTRHIHGFRRRVIASMIRTIGFVALGRAAHSAGKSKEPSRPKWREVGSSHSRGGTGSVSPIVGIIGEKTCAGR